VSHGVTDEVILCTT